MSRPPQPEIKAPETGEPAHGTRMPQNQSTTRRLIEAAIANKHNDTRYQEKS
jgi:hypothetical protein